ncbi:putative dipeptidase-like protein [Hapsidospora chrysogenum ATCC 11550]|uniref:Dipeptidase n=1 Tax=Hapsidospora chrysogenum (strain ATCC 11550 / CBS 779.69 / DSM 880 / IAM 14645 / JCM 23072 / IMI 49137) TaxID=857340 RepID=A0A086TA45_HAPC1|nr:putative dipeptidase-like protein [Hapsidospora chrysogenum ATCC 11550]
MAPIPPNDIERASHEKGALPSSPASPRPRRVSPRRLIASIFIFLLTFSFLHRPLGRRGNDHFCRRHSVEQRARRVLSMTPLIDGHVDMPVLIRALYKNKIANDEWREAFEDGSLPGHVDIKRLREGLSGGAFWSVFAPCPKNGSDFSDENLAQSVQFTLDQIDLMTRVQAMYPDDFSPAQGLHADAALDAWAEGKFISPLGIEGLHQIGNKASNLRRFYDLGVRYATLTHNCHNKYADAGLQEHPLSEATPIHHGVSEEGRQLIQEMNRIGMIVDLAHVSEETMVDVLGGSDDWPGSRAPVIYSHSSAYAICPHPRNVKDHVLKLVKERNSVVLVNIAGQFIACRDVGADNGIPEPVPEDATLGRVVEHIMYIGDLVGYDHVGVGTDLDGISDPPEGFGDVTAYPELVAELLRRGVSDDDAAKVVGGNVLRVWEDVEVVAAKMQAEGVPALEDDLVDDWS